MQDKNGNTIRPGDIVVVPEPKTNDPWQYGNFSATVKEFKDDTFISVEDADGDHWVIEASRVEKENV